MFHSPIAMVRLARIASVSLLSGAAAFAAATSTATAPAANAPTLRINEVMADNTKLANAGTFPDMIELYNAGSAAIDLTGKVLQDEPADPANVVKFVFPSGTTLAAGAYLVVYADKSTSAPGLHTGFGLDAEGDSVKLYESAAKGGALIDAVSFGFQIPDYSLSRTGAGGSTWALTLPTFGRANGDPVTLGTPDDVRINEWAGNITFRVDHDFAELYNRAADPVALGGVKLTDDVTHPKFTYPVLSFIAGKGFISMVNGAKFVFGFSGASETLTLLGENSATIDQVRVVGQANDQSTGRSPDGADTTKNFAVPTPGLSNDTPLPPNYAALLSNLRITEIMYDPAPAGSGNDYEFIELQNIGATSLALGGVRFTNGIDYTFPAGTTLAAGAFIVVASDHGKFLSRYPAAAGVLAAGSYAGSLDNSGETLALTLPVPWDVNVLQFRYDPAWFPATAGGGYSLVVPSPATTAPEDWGKRTTWRQSVAVNGSPGAADTGVAGAVTARLSNLSVRTAMAANQTLIVGVVVSGGARNVLVRAAGPALAGFGLANAMADPRLDLYNGSTLELSNDNWDASLASTFTSVGAFPFATGSRDAALLPSMDGARSIQARGTGAGVVLVEAYDTGTTNSPRLINVSARNQVGTGDNILIAGFTIAGTGAKQLLIRAVGPKLSAFGVSGFLTDPKLEVYSSAGVKLNENDNWASTLAPTFTAVGAFPLDSGSRDAALLVNLDPGSYTVQVRGADGGTGEALVEIYEVP